jgi:hypothetical protein
MQYDGAVGLAQEVIKVDELDRNAFSSFYGTNTLPGRMSISGQRMEET